MPTFGHSVPLALLVLPPGMVKYGRGLLHIRYYLLTAYSCPCTVATMQTRALQAQELFLAGRSYREIGEALGVSRQYAQQLVRPPAIVYNLVKRLAAGCCQRCGIAVRSGHVHHVGTTNRTLDNFNDLDNLKYLCPSCHRAEHGAPRDLAPEGFTRASVVLTENRCHKCGYVWIPRVSSPKHCPYCKIVQNNP